MGKTAFIFPGQGAQKVGMGKDLYEKYPKIKELYELANQVLGLNIRDLSFEGPQEELTESKNAQPAIFLHSVACYKLTKENPEVVAGHSLGEYSALFAAGVLGLDDALHLVRFRGELMSKTNPGTMAAVIGVPTIKIEEVINDIKSEGIITIANYNSPLQTVISGSPEMIEKASNILREQGARRVIQLNVSGAFHSSLMESAFTKFKLVLGKTKLKSPSIPVVPNATGKLTTSLEEIRNALSRQIISPVKWVDSIENMVKFDVDTFVELGPGKVLTGLIKHINPNVQTINPEFI